MITSLNELRAVLGLAPEENNPLVESLSLDSRMLGPNSVFIALKEGEAFIEEAKHKACVGILKESEIPNLRDRLSALANVSYPLSQDLRIIGVTGTNGKTSVAYFIAELLNSLNRPCTYLGTLNAPLTTPDRITLGKMIHEAQTAQVALEISSHALEQNRIQDLPIQVGVFTNLTQDHLDYHLRMESYAEAKAKLFRLPSLKLAVLNREDPYFSFFKNSLHSSCSLLSYGFSPSADIFIESLQRTPSHTLLRIQTPRGKFETQTSLMGDFNGLNLLAMIGAVWDQTISLDELAKTIPQLKPPPGRMELHILKNGARVIIDYAHTPDALEKVLRTLRPYTPGKLYCVFGCGGNRDPGKRSLMGRIAEQLSDLVILTQDNSRFENPSQIFAQILSGFTRSKPWVIPDRAEAIHFACKNLNPQDTLLLSGKGHELYLDIQGKKIPFDERIFLQNFKKS